MSHCGAFVYTFLPQKRNNTFLSYCFWRSCTCQQYKSVQCYHENVPLASLRTFVELQNIRIKWVCLYSYLSYPARTSHLFCAVLYYLWPVWLYRIFPHYLISGMILGKNWIQNVISGFLYSFCLNHYSFILRTIQGAIIRLEWPSCKVPVIVVKYQ